VQTVQSFGRRRKSRYLAPLAIVTFAISIESHGATRPTPGSDELIRQQQRHRLSANHS